MMPSQAGLRNGRGYNVNNCDLIPVNLLRGDWRQRPRRLRVNFTMRSIEAL
jgi:hypothetical protein